MGAIQTRGPSVCGCSARLGVTEVWWDCTSSLGRASKTMGRVLVQPLAYLKALAREQHFGRAAQACHISQATLSAAVRKLEDELGATLILRDSRFQGLTQEGVRAVEWAHHILGDFDAMRDEVAAVRDTGDTRLRIRAIPSAAGLVVSLAGRLALTRPALNAVIRSAAPAEIERALLESDIDVGVTYLGGERPPRLHCQSLYEEQYVLITSNIVGATGPIRWAEIGAGPICFLASDPRQAESILAALAQARLPVRPVIQVGTAWPVPADVADGDMRVIMPQPCLKDLILPAGVVARPLIDPAISLAVGMIWSSRKPERPLVRELRELAELRWSSGAGVAA
jgi:DNA-binding transcriptional LysR family regulator